MITATTGRVSMLAAFALIYEHAEALVKTSDAAGTYAAARLKAHEAGIKVPHT